MVVEPTSMANTVGVFAKTRPDRDDLVAAVHRHRHLPVALAQGLLQLLKHEHIAFQVGQPPLELQRIFESAQVARRVVHVGLLHLDKVQPNHRVDLNVMRLGLLAHHLAVHLAAGRHIDDHVAQQLGRAGQTATCRHRFNGLRHAILVLHL